MLGLALRSVPSALATDSRQYVELCAVVVKAVLKRSNLAAPELDMMAQLLQPERRPPGAAGATAADFLVDQMAAVVEEVVQAQPQRDEVLALLDRHLVQLLVDCSPFLLEPRPLSAFPLDRNKVGVVFDRLRDALYLTVVDGKWVNADGPPADCSNQGILSALGTMSKDMAERYDPTAKELLTISVGDRLRAVRRSGGDNGAAAIAGRNLLLFSFEGLNQMSKDTNKIVANLNTEGEATSFLALALKLQTMDAGCKQVGLLLPRLQHAVITGSGPLIKALGANMATAAAVSGFTFSMADVYARHVEPLVALGAAGIERLAIGVYGQLANVTLLAPIEAEELLRIVRTLDSTVGAPGLGTLSLPAQRAKADIMTTGGAGMGCLVDFLQAKPSKTAAEAALVQVMALAVQAVDMKSRGRGVFDILLKADVPELLQMRSAIAPLEFDAAASDVRRVHGVSLGDHESTTLTPFIDALQKKVVVVIGDEQFEGVKALMGVVGKVLLRGPPRGKEQAFNSFATWFDDEYVPVFTMVESVVRHGYLASQKGLASLDSASLRMAQAMSDMKRQEDTRNIMALITGVGAAQADVETPLESQMEEVEEQLVELQLGEVASQPETAVAVPDMGLNMEEFLRLKHDKAGKASRSFWQGIMSHLPGSLKALSSVAVGARG